MKQIVKNYSFSTVAKTITLTDYGTIRLDRIQLITDTTTNKILYNFADSTVATATVATNVITLSALQGGEANADALMIVYDNITGDPTYDTPVLPNGAATAANQTTANTSLATIATNTLTVGQKTMANSSPVVIASDQSSLPVTLNAETTKVIGTINQGTSPWVTNISQINGGTAFPLETNTFADSKIGFMAFARTTGSGSGAVVKPLIVDGNGNLGTNLADVGGSAIALGQTTMTASLPVVIASNQTTFPVTVKTATGIQDKQAGVAAFTITLASLASSTSGVGRQSTLVDNTTNLYTGAKIYLKVKMGTTPTANSLVYVYLIQYDNSAVADDSAGTADAGLTVVNASLLGTILCNSATTGNSYTGIFDTSRIVDSLGPKWGIAIVNSTGVALDSTEASHTKNYIGFTRNLV